MFGLRQEAYESQKAFVKGWCKHSDSAGELKTALDTFRGGKLEEDLYDPFVTICTCFIKKAQDELKAMVQRSIVVKKHDAKSIEGINARKPDAVIVTAGMETERTWSPILCAIELKRIEYNEMLHPGRDGDDEQPKKRSRGSHPVSGWRCEVGRKEQDSVTGSIGRYACVGGRLGRAWVDSDAGCEYSQYRRAGGSSSRDRCAGSAGRLCDGDAHCV